MNVLPFAQNLVVVSNSRDAAQQTQVSQSGWQREMERAAVQSWLRHPVVEHQSTTSFFRSPTYVANASRLHDGVRQSEQMDLASKPTQLQQKEEHPSSFLKSPQFTAHRYSTNDVIQGEAKQNPSLAAKNSDSGIHSNGSIVDTLSKKLNLALSDALDSSISSKNEEAQLDSRFNKPTRDSTEFNVKSQPSLMMGDSAIQQDLRLYAEWSDQGVSLWLGVDAQHEEMIPQLVNHLLRQLSEKGIQVVTLVCNGKTLFEHVKHENEVRSSDAALVA